jgi:hypothetical protein
LSKISVTTSFKMIATGEQLWQDIL